MFVCNVFVEQKFEQMRFVQFVEFLDSFKK